MVNEVDNPNYNIKTLRTFLSNWKLVNKHNYNIGTSINLLNSGYKYSFLKELNILFWRKKSVNAFLSNLKVCRTLKNNYGIDIEKLKAIVKEGKEVIPKID